MITTKTSHNKGLYFLFFTEMWEKFSFFGMRSLLVYYMTKQLLFTQEQTSHIYGFYTGLIYFTPFLGGILADRFWGKHRMMVIGGILMIVGHFFMIFDSLFFPALLLLILGSGALVPNISAKVGTLYSVDDPRYDQAFSIFYLGINIGAFLSPIVCGILGEIYGWRYGFGAAGVGMSIGLLIYLAGQKYLSRDDILQHSGGFNENKREKNNTISRRWFVLLMLFAILFRAAYGQQGNTIALWLDHYTDRHIFGWEMPASLFQSFNPLLVIVFTPAILALWRWQAKHNCEFTSVTKIALGCVITGISYLIMIAAAHNLGLQNKSSLFWPIVYIILLTIGELYMSPIALSLVTKIASAKTVSMMLGIWFLSYFAGNYLSGILGMLWGKISKEMFFLIISLIAFSAGLGVLSIAKPFKKLAIDNETTEMFEPMTDKC